MILRSPFIRPLLMCGLSLAISCLWLTTTAQGQLTHYVPFDTGYTLGAGNFVTGAGGSDLGFGTNTWFVNGVHDINAGSLTPSAGLGVAGNHAQISGFDTAFYTMDLDGDGNNGEPEDALADGVHWLSLTGRSTLNSAFGGFSFVTFFGPENLYIGKVGGDGSTTWGFDGPLSGLSAVAGSDATLDTLLVARLTITGGSTGGTADLYINPSLGTAPPAVADITGYAFSGTLNEIRLGGEFAADEIRIGATFNDVVGVPEPASFAVISVIGLAIAGRRRR